MSGIHGILLLAGVSVQTEFVITHALFMAYKTPRIWVRPEVYDWLILIDRSLRMLQSIFTFLSSPGHMKQNIDLE